MGVGGRGHGVGGGGRLVWLGGLGVGDFLQGGVLVGQEGPWGELVGLWLSPNVTGHVGQSAVGRCRRG